MCSAGSTRTAGIPGSKEDRPGFQAMMAAARKGQVDLILTKSVSRFARNTEMLLSAVRELKGLGIGVIFEEQQDQHPERGGRTVPDDPGLLR